MTEQPNGLVKKQGLSEAELNEIKKLLIFCQEYDHQKLKINWNFLYTRSPEETSDFCYYANQKLVGYLPLDGFGSDFEITGMVHPDHRRKGIFNLLVKEAQLEAGRRKASELLLVVGKASVAGQAFAKTYGTQYDFSEYRLELSAPDFHPVPTPDIRLEQASNSDLDLLTRIHALNFGETEEENRAMVKLEVEEANSRVYIAQLGAVAVGKIGAVGENGRAYIRGVGIIPEYRGFGYGRQLLSGIISKLIAEGQTYFELDVETKNSNALSLYLSRGFKEANAFDYFQLPIL